MSISDSSTLEVLGKPSQTRTRFAQRLVRAMTPRGPTKPMAAGVTLIVMDSGTNRNPRQGVSPDITISAS